MKVSRDGQMERMVSNLEGNRNMLVTCSGILVADIFATDLPGISHPGQLTFAPKGIELHSGGHAANVSVDLRKTGLSEGEVSSIGAIGEDLFGTYIEGVLKSYGVITHLQRTRNIGTSKDLILVVTGEDRRYHIDIGANWYLSPDHVLSVLIEEEPTVFYVGATGMLGKFDEKLVEILQRASGCGCLTFVDPILPYRGGWDFLFQALKWIDIFHCNSDEAFSMTGEREPKKAAKALAKEGTKLVIISMGERGLIARAGQVTIEMPAPRVQVVDPSGAGDAFCSGVIYGLIRKMRYERPDMSKLSTNDVTNILLEGTATGAVCVTAVGTTTAVTRENVDQLLRQQGPEILGNVVMTTEGE